MHVSSGVRLSRSDLTLAINLTDIRNRTQRTFDPPASGTRNRAKPNSLRLAQWHGYYKLLRLDLMWLSGSICRKRCESHGQTPCFRSMKPMSSDQWQALPPTAISMEVERRPGSDVHCRHGTVAKVDVTPASSLPSTG
jgi:hypothetical protein